MQSAHRCRKSNSFETFAKLTRENSFRKSSKKPMKTILVSIGRYVLGGLLIGGTADGFAAEAGVENVDRELRSVLASQRFTGRVESTLEKRLGRPLDPAKAELGRLLFFDKFVGLHGDNSCAGCHSPLNGFGDSVSMAIGVENNGFVGPQRAGPRNQRRTPAVVNTAFYPKLMWNGRFSAISGDPFDSSKGFLFPAPEGTTRFPPNVPDFNICSRLRPIFRRRSFRRRPVSRNLW